MSGEQVHPDQRDRVERLMRLARQVVEEFSVFLLRGERGDNLTEVCDDLNILFDYALNHELGGVDRANLADRTGFLCSGVIIYLPRMLQGHEYPGKEAGRDDLREVYHNLKNQVEAIRKADDNSGVIEELEGLRTLFYDISRDLGERVRRADRAVRTVPLD